MTEKILQVICDQMNVELVTKKYSLNVDEWTATCPSGEKFTGTYEQLVAFVSGYCSGWTYGQNRMMEFRKKVKEAIEGIY